MKNTVLLIIVLTCGIASTALAQIFPDYYPENGFQDVGVIDDIDHFNGFIIIGDIEYRLSSKAVVRSLSSKEDSMARLRAGTMVGFRLLGTDIITEFWLLPNNYGSTRRR